MKTENAGVLEIEPVARLNLIAGAKCANGRNHKVAWFRDTVFFCQFVIQLFRNEKLIGYAAMLRKLNNLARPVERDAVSFPLTLENPLAGSDIEYIAK